MFLLVLLTEFVSFHQQILLRRHFAIAMLAGAVILARNVYQIFGACLVYVSLTFSFITVFDSI